MPTLCQRAALRESLLNETYRLVDDLAEHEKEVIIQTCMTLQAIR